MFLLLDLFLHVSFFSGGSFWTLRQGCVWRMIYALEAGDWPYQKRSQCHNCLHWYPNHKTLHENEIAEALLRRISFFHLSHGLVWVCFCFFFHQHFCYSLLSLLLSFWMGLVVVRSPMSCRFFLVEEERWATALSRWIFFQPF